MKVLKVTYRTVFRQPLGWLNPLGVKLACDIEVEIYESAGKWFARRPGTRSEFAEIPCTTAASSMKRNVEQCFATFIHDWQMFRPTGEPVLPAEIRIQSDGRVMELEPEDFTHIQDTEGDSNRKYAMSICGRSFKHQAFASTLENAPPPTCAMCAAKFQQAKEAQA